MVAADAVGVVLCGGTSSRMGVDKAVLELDGVAMARRTVDALRAVGVGEVLTVGGDGPALAGVGDRHVDDVYPGEGPLGGVATAAATVPDRPLMVVACDLPDLTPVVLGRLWAAAGEQVVVPRVAGRPQWAVAVVPGPAAAESAARFAAGARSLREGYGEVVAVDVADDGALDDLDSPDDVARWRSRAAGGAPWAPGGSVARMEKPEIDVEALAGLMTFGEVALLDVRMPDEYEEAHVPGAVLVPLPELADRLGDVPQGDVVYVICRSGARSAKAVQILAAAGVDAANVAGGTMDWVDSGRDVATGAEPG